MKRATIYLVTNTINGNTYIGVTRKSPAARWTQHVYTATQRQGKTRLYAAIRKYGAEAFRIEAVAISLSVADAGVVERAVIETFRPVYNQTNGGEITIGRRVAPEVAERIRQGSLGKKRTPEMNARNSAQAKARLASSPEHKAIALAALAKGRVNVDEAKRIAAVSKACAARVWSDESRAKLSASCMGRRYGPEVISKIAAKNCKMVECTTLNAVFDSVSEAAEALGLVISNVSEVCRGKRKAAGGLIFEFI